MKRLYDAMFCFNAGACIAAFVLAQMFVMPQLFTASFWFALGAAGFYIGARWGVR